MSNEIHIDNEIHKDDIPIPKKSGPAANLSNLVKYNLSNSSWSFSSVGCIGVYWPTIVNTLLQNNKFCEFLDGPKSLACFLVAVDPRLLPFIIKHIKTNEKLTSTYNKVIEIPEVKESLISNLDKVLKAPEWKNFNECYILLNMEYSEYRLDDDPNYKEWLIKEWRNDNTKQTNVCIVKITDRSSDKDPVYICDMNTIKKVRYSVFNNPLSFFRNTHLNLDHELRKRCENQIKQNICGMLLGYEPICTTEMLTTFRNYLHKLTTQKQQEPDGDTSPKVKV